MQDPDPNAVDHGRVLGIRIEVFDASKKSCSTPYYVFLNRPNGVEGAMKVHKHTVPAHIGIKSIAYKYLPQEGKQDLERFARALRKALVSHQKALDAIEMLRREAGLREADGGADASEAGPIIRSGNIQNLEAVDVSAREIIITWDDGCVGRVSIGTDGGITHASVRDAAQNDGDVGRRRKDRERAISAGIG